MNRKNILIVDDSEFDRVLFKKALNKLETFKILEAETGEECFKVLDQEKIDLILMDILMPGIFGTDVLRKIRNKFNALTLPIIMVTSKTDISDIVESLRNGANDYITKPVNFEIALSRINTHLKLAEASQEMVRLKEIAALDGIITTYNHEINNPLMIAIGCLSASDMKATKYYSKLETALWRIANIVKQIRHVTEKKEIDYQDYSGLTKMVKVK